MRIRVRRKNALLSGRREIQRAWNQADTLPGFDPNTFRISDDDFRAVIRRDCLNHRRNFGWTVRDGRAICYGDLSMLTELSVVVAHDAQRQQLH